MKKHINYFLVFIINFFVLINVNASDTNGNSGLNICESSALFSLRIVGYCLFVIKILVPIILIIIASVDFGRAMLSGDEKDLKAASSNFIKKFIIGVVVFFIPLLLNYILSLVAGFSDLENNFEKCTVCVLDVTSEECNENIQYVESITG